jgi:hypothetical protein
MSRLRIRRLLPMTGRNRPTPKPVPNDGARTAGDSAITALDDDAMVADEIDIAAPEDGARVASEIGIAALKLAGRAHAAGLTAIGHLLETVALEAGAESAARQWPARSPRR